MPGSTFILAIDGPAGAGKSSIAGAVARRLGMTRVDTGAIYRGVLPFIAIQLLMLLVLALFPGLATWLPAQM